jgi:putative oxidoreductase
VAHVFDSAGTGESHFDRAASENFIRYKGERRMASTNSSPLARSQSLPASFAGTGPIVLLGRFLFVLIFLLSGPRHFLSATIAYAAAQGVPMASIAVPISGILALAGGLSILLGFRARLGAWLIILFLVGVTPMMHSFWKVSDPMMYQMQFVMFMKNMSMLGGALIISQLGSGPWSLDSRRK